MRRNLAEPEALHLVELVEEERSRRPHVRYDTVDLENPAVGSAVGA